MRTDGFDPPMAGLVKPGWPARRRIDKMNRLNYEHI